MVYEKKIMTSVVVLEPNGVMKERKITDFLSANAGNAVSLSKVGTAGPTS